MNEIFTHFIARGDKEEDAKRLTYATWFIHSFPEAEFEAEDFLFYKYLEFSVQLHSVIKYDYFQIWIDTELRRLLRKSNVKVVGCESLRYEDPLSFETAVRTTTEVLQDNFKVLEMRPSEVDDFPVVVSNYMTARLESRLTQALSSTFEILNETSNSIAACDSLDTTLTLLRNIYDVKKIEKLQSTDADDDDGYDELITTSGIPLIDNDSKGLYATQLLGVEAQSGTGKTRFVLGTYVYNALTKYHKNVAFYALEQRKREVHAMLLSHHIFEMFKVQIPDNMIRQNTVPDEYKHYVEAARFDLFKSGKYGKFVCYDDPLYIEEFTETLDVNDKLQGPFDLIVIDYMGIIKSKPGKYGKKLSRVEIIDIAYPEFKSYVRTRAKAGIAIGQFNKEGVDAGKADKTITTDMAQGGMVVYQNTDYNIAISMTDTMHAQNKRRFSQPKVRGTPGFPPFMVDVRLGILLFMQSMRKEA